jgi:polyisoprenoid-binding protein YceI
MKSIVMSIAAIGIMSLGSNTAAFADSNPPLKVNTEKSTIFWTGKKVTGEHTGTVQIKDGEVVVENGVPTLVKLSIDFNTIVVTDIKDPGTNAKLLGHLKSADFFNVAEFPTGKFESTKLVPIQGAKDRESNYTVTGTLTLKGISHEIEFPAFISTAKNTVIANGKLSFDRTKWDIRYGSGSFFEGLGDKAIYDDVDLNFVFMAN